LGEMTPGGRGTVEIKQGGGLGGLRGYKKFCSREIIRGDPTILRG